MRDTTRSNIKGFLEGFLDALVEDFESADLDPRELRPYEAHSTNGRRKPFHQALLPHGLLTITEFERSLSTRLGSTYEEVARLLALEHHGDAARQYSVEGAVSNEQIRNIRDAVQFIEKRGAREGFSFPELVDNVLSADGRQDQELQVTVDLRIVTRSGSEALFEIKSPKPNKGQCLEATQRLLRIHAMRGASPPDVCTFYGMAYNPWGETLAEYRHSFSMSYLDLDNEVLLEKDFWNFVGGPGAYQDVIELYREVGREKGPDMIDRLALGY
ncbi:MAG: TdeIII family type II restriction endonuclease [bacterium]